MTVTAIEPRELAELSKRGKPIDFIDVRTPTEYREVHVPGAANVPVDELRHRLGELPRGRAIAAYCQVGQRGYLATRVLLQAGFAAANVGGGYKTYLLFHPAA